MEFTRRQFKRELILTGVINILAKKANITTDEAFKIIEELDSINIEVPENINNIAFKGLYDE